MRGEELHDDIETTLSFTQRYLGISIGNFLVLLIIVLSLGVYLGVILYGTNSLEVLFGLSEYEQFLEKEVERLKNENAQLQKEYFELKEISAQ